MKITEIESIETANPNVAPEITVNGVLIDEDSILAEMQYHPADNHRAAMVKAAESLIIDELIRQQATVHGLESDNSGDDYELVHRLLNIEAPVPQASEIECERFFEQNRGKFSTSPLLEVRHILLAVAPEDIEERIHMKEAAEQLIATLKQDKSSFESLAKTHSRCPSMSMGGSLGQISKGQTVPEFEKHVFAAKEGLVEYPIETRYGYHIVLIDRKVEGAELPYDYVKQDVQDYLNEKVTRKATAQYIENLIQAAVIKGFQFQQEDSPLMQ